jgi:hypothetical protein
MSKHQYILEPYKGMNTRYRCPSCQRDKTFSLYIVMETGEHIHPSVGRCNRESNCGYHYTPKQYFQDNNISFDTSQPKVCETRPVTPQPKPTSFIPVEVFKNSLNNTALETNHFVKFLIDLFGVEVTSQLISRYFIATSKHWNGATIFWQIDTQGKVRTGKIMLYNPTTGKRVKEPFNHIYWVHKAITQPEFELKQCLFGEHLLIDKTKPVAIVESEKTALIASVYLPQFIWVAVGSLTNLNADKCNILKGRAVTLFPDLNGFDKWSSKAKELSHLATFTVSDLLECKATEIERLQGLDIADYLIRDKFKAFVLSHPGDTRPLPAIQPIKVKTPGLIKSTCYFSEHEQPKLEEIRREDFSPLAQDFSKHEQPKLEDWEKDITDLEKYFAGITPPIKPIKLNNCSTIIDYSLFIESHLATVKANNGKRTYLPYLNRLQELKQVLKANLN